MLSFILIIFVAAAFQLFRVNQAIYLSVTAAHTQMFNGAWTANCFNKSSRCIYNSDRHAQVRWHPTTMPEVLVPTVGVFQRRLPGQLRLTAWPGAATPRRDGYKRTRMGAGTYYPICQCASANPLSSSCMTSLYSVPGMGVC
jgi:hypothetical protein